MVDALLLVSNKYHFDNWRTVDTLRYLLFQWLTYWLYFDILIISMTDVLFLFEIVSILMIDALFILWDNEYFDGSRIVVSLK